MTADLYAYSAATAPDSGVDRLSALLERFRVRAHLFHAGPLCGVTHFAAQPGRAFLHVLRRGDMWVTHQPRSGAPRKLRLTEPTLLFYPRPLDHDFHNAPVDGSDFVCATLDFDGGVRHPLVQALPSVLALPVEQVQGIEQTLQLLFAETERVRAKLSFACTIIAIIRPMRAAMRTEKIVMATRSSTRL